MSNYLRVFCRSTQSISRREIAELIEDGVYFEPSPLFDPPLDSEATALESWDQLLIFYAADKRPVVITRNVADDFLRTEVAEIIEELGSSVTSEILERLSHTFQVIAIEIGIGELPDEVWEMIDMLLTYIAKTLDGIIYVAGEGFYDDKLQWILKL